MPPAREARKCRDHPPGCQNLSWSNLSDGASCFRWKKPNTVLEIAPGGVLPPRLKRTASKMSFPCTRHVDFPKARKRDCEPKKGVQLPPRKRPRVRQRISKETPNQPKVPPGIPRKARWTPSFPQTPQRPPQETILPPKDLLGYHFASHLEHVLSRENQ